MTRSQIKLKSIAAIRSGYHFRSKIISDERGAFQVIQMKNINQYNELDLRDVIRSNLENSSSSKNLLRSHDILFQSRGGNNNFVLVPEGIENAVADYSLMVISVKPDKLNKVDPGYLVWSLNHPRTQHQISRFTEGSSILRVSKTALENLKIKLPPLTKQKLIAEIDRLSKREQQLLASIAEKRQSYIARSLGMEVIR